jgi:REP element-mobilizing transposase RayT
MYHIVCPAKYRRAVITKDVDEKLKEICKGIEERYEIQFLEIGTEKNHVYFLVQVQKTEPAVKIRIPRRDIVFTHHLTPINGIFETGLIARGKSRRT